MSERPPDATGRLLEALTRRFAQPPAELVAADDEGETAAGRWSYLEAAAVLHCFDPGALRPLDPSLAVPSPRALLFGDTTPAVGEREGGFHSLKPEIRREALRRLGGRERLRSALAANPDRDAALDYAVLRLEATGRPGLRRQAHHPGLSRAEGRQKD